MVVSAAIGVGALVSEAFATAAIDTPVPRATPTHAAPRVAKNPFVLPVDAVSSNVGNGAVPTGGAVAAGVQVIGVVVKGKDSTAILAGNGELHLGDHVDAQRYVTSISEDAVRLSDGSIIPVDPFGTALSSQSYLVPSLTPPVDSNAAAAFPGGPSALPSAPQGAPAAAPQASDSYRPSVSAPSAGGAMTLPTVVPTPPPPYGTNGVPLAPYGSQTASPQP
jgi:hypothetical protein